MRGMRRVAALACGIGSVRCSSQMGQSHPPHLRELETSFSRMLQAAKQVGFGSERMLVADLPVEPRIMLSLIGGPPNGNLSPTEEGTGIGIEINAGVLRLDKLGREFVLGHELGHACCQSVLSAQGLLTPQGELQQGLSVGVHEVIADLCAVQLLHVGLGYSWSQLMRIPDKGLEWGVFDEQWSGHHPPAAVRGKTIRALITQLERGVDFNTATPELLKELPSPLKSRL